MMRAPVTVVLFKPGLLRAGTTVGPLARGYVLVQPAKSTVVELNWSFWLKVLVYENPLLSLNHLLYPK